MKDFPVRPTGTLMSGTFRSSTEAERALRVLKNAGYARADVVADSQAIPGAPIVVVVDAAATGAFRAAEILEEHGAAIAYAEPAFAAKAEHAVTPPPSVPIVAAPLAAAPLAAERKPRVRKRNRSGTQPPAAPLERTDVVIVTRGIESLSSST